MGDITFIFMGDIMKSKSKSKSSALDEIVNDLITLMESGVKPWRCPWSASDAMPRNFSTGNEYSGVNIFTMWMYAAKFEFSSNHWLTFKQASSLGYKVIKGSKSVPVFFYKSYEVEDENYDDGRKKLVKVLKNFRAFNIDQVVDEKGNPVKVDTSNSEPPISGDIFDAMEKLKSEYSEKSGVRFFTSGGKAFYSPSNDKINMPDFSLFDSEDGYASTLLHEILHSTGAEHRLNRFSKQDAKYGLKDSYAIEELTADIGACFLGSYYGVSGEVENHASYLASWLKQLRNDKSLFFKAAADAQKAYTYFFSILDKTSKRAA